MYVVPIKRLFKTFIYEFWMKNQADIIWMGYYKVNYFVYFYKECNILIKCLKDYENDKVVFLEK